ncbi:hypothetical protein BDN71DRAFT_1448647 [Pleurotus eryngii]|uniref:Uncharacterized protein n=1 Tax=Pleurotus eryngii TaxID=5323 RepID=A0A9P5ZW87_PLEER|nr:hypothetical protein BDN71DRAFT_1448647 [Pleurotus eryngii]
MQSSFADPNFERCTSERDSQLIWRLAKVLRDGQRDGQTGDNTNLVDYLYAGNAADAQVLPQNVFSMHPRPFLERLSSSPTALLCAIRYCHAVVQHRQGVRRSI